MFSKIAIVAVLGIATVGGCKKKESLEDMQMEKLSEKNNSISDQKIEHDKLLAFFAWSIEVPVDSISFDPSSDELFIPNTIVREKLERVREEYSRANVYKDNFEKK